MTSRNFGACLVCGAPAIGINFTVLTCGPCKAFFRRNAVKLGIVDFVCRSDGDCAITWKSRRICKCCRLAKCFRLGMEKSLILTEAAKEARKEIIQQNREKRAQLLNSQSSELIRSSNLLRLTHSQSTCLSSSDQTLLTNIFHAYEQTCIAGRNNRSLYFPSRIHVSIHGLFNEYSDRHESLIEYLKLIPEFNRLSIDDKLRLIQNHFGMMLCVNESNNRPREINTLLVTLRNVYGIQLSMYILRCIGSIERHGYDPILIKLILIVQSLTSGISENRFNIDMNRIYDNTKRIFVAQNIYVELLWKYVLSHSSSERDVVRFFDKLVLDSLQMLRVSSIMDDYVLSFPNEIDQMVPLMQSMWCISNT